MAELILGPLLRHVGETCAVFWVETDEACEVRVLGRTERTFCVEGHHYALVCVAGLARATQHTYEVELDGERAWPPPGSDFPPSRFRTYPKDAALRLAFGSCRVAVPNEPPYTLRKDDDERGRELDALRALALRMRGQPFEEWPDVLLLLGDQVYADEVSPRTERFVRSRRTIDEEPGAIALDFEEYTRLYRESWGEPIIRWLLSTVSSVMIFDDHDVHDDWNISWAWVQRMRRSDWWDEHIVGALTSYWVYQHIGNLSPGEQAADELLARVRARDDGGPLLRDFALRADRETEGTRWSYHRDLGDTRLIVIDSRCGRVLSEGRRAMLDEEEWSWIEQQTHGDFDHLLLATSLPWLLAPGLHHLEAWSEAVCDGAWGRPAARLAERLRQALDLEHWAAFNASFHRLAELQRSVGAGERGAPPASIVTLSGDVHHAYLAEVAFRRGSGVRSAVYQAVCSPLRNPLGTNERRTIRFASSRLAQAATRRLARLAGVRPEPVRWRQVGDGPWFDNQVATLRIDGRRMELAIDKALPDAGAGGWNGRGEPRLERVFSHRIA